MKITGISKLQFNVIQKIIDSIENTKFRDLCNITKNQHVLYYDGEYNIHPAFNSGEYRSIFEYWSKHVPALRTIEFSLAQIIAQLILEQANQLLHSTNVQRQSVTTSQSTSKAKLLPDKYVSQQLDKTGKDISILDVLEMSDEQIGGNTQLMQYRTAIGTIMNLSSKYLKSWSLGIERPIELGGSDMPYKLDARTSRQLLQAKNKLRSRFTDDEIDHLLAMIAKEND